MTRNILTILLIALGLNVFGQSNEYSFRLNTGLSNFSGASAESTERINYNLDKEEGYTNNPYGNKFGFSYGLSFNLTKVTKSNLRLGIDLGYEAIGSKIAIDGVFLRNNSVNETISATGKTRLQSNLINLFPSIGYQISNSSYRVYLDVGFDIGYILNTTEKGIAKTTERDYETNRDRGTINLDVRPRFQIGISKNKYGGYIGFSKGLVNYKTGFVGGTNETFINYIRFGLTYQL